jgi:DNA-binding NtrC family response regulator
MVSDQIQSGEVNIVASGASWAWPSALRSIFEPRGVSLLVADKADEFVSVIKRKRIHAAIVDMDSRSANALATVRVIRIAYPRLPCILLGSSVNRSDLDRALRLDVFSVIDKPVDMSLLQNQLNRLFVKRYSNDIFA